MVQKIFAAMIVEAFGSSGVNHLSRHGTGAVGRRIWQANLQIIRQENFAGH
jgi:hypothetical protein